MGLIRQIDNAKNVKKRFKESSDHGYTADPLFAVDRDEIEIRNGDLSLGMEEL
jgi:hypothetical protein